MQVLENLEQIRKLLKSMKIHEKWWTRVQSVEIHENAFKSNEKINEILYNYIEKVLWKANEIHKNMHDKS